MLTDDSVYELDKSELLVNPDELLLKDEYELDTSEIDGLCMLTVASVDALNDRELLTVEYKLDNSEEDELSVNTDDSVDELDITELAVVLDKLLVIDRYELDNVDKRDEVIEDKTSLLNSLKDDTGG